MCEPHGPGPHDNHTKPGYVGQLRRGEEVIIDHLPFSISHFSLLIRVDQQALMNPLYDLANDQ
jgi:hypothetical protein